MLSPGATQNSSTTLLARCCQILPRLATLREAVIKGDLWTALTRNLRLISGLPARLAYDTLELVAIHSFFEVLTFAKTRFPSNI